MPMWRCPHCGTPQAETARCWVCRRSSTTCATCRHYRRSVAAQLGYCGLDRRRQPLTGDEIRGCWEGWPVDALSGTAARPTIGPAGRPSADEGRRHLAFVELDAAAPDVDAFVASSAPAIAAPADEPGWSLWGDGDL